MLVSLRAADTAARVPLSPMLEQRDSCRPAVKSSGDCKRSVVPAWYESIANVLGLAIVGILGIVGIGIHRESGARLTPLPCAIGLRFLD